MGTPGPEDLTSPSLDPSLPTPWLLSPLLTSFSDEKKKNCNAPSLCLFK